MHVHFVVRHDMVLNHTDTQREEKAKASNNKRHQSLRVYCFLLVCILPQLSWPLHFSVLPKRATRFRRLMLLTTSSGGQKRNF